MPQPERTILQRKSGLIQLIRLTEISTKGTVRRCKLTNRWRIGLIDHNGFSIELRKNMAPCLRPALNVRRIWLSMHDRGAPRCPVRRSHWYDSNLLKASFAPVAGNATVRWVGIDRG